MNMEEDKYIDLSCHLTHNIYCFNCRKPFTATGTIKVDNREFLEIKRQMFRLYHLDESDERLFCVDCLIKILKEQYGQVFEEEENA